MTAKVLADLELSIPEVAEVLDRTGIVCLEGVVSPDWLKDAQENVKSLLAEYGTRYFRILHPGNETDSPAHRLISDPAVPAILQNLAVARTEVAGNEKIFSVLRVVGERRGPDNAFEFHYDAEAVTMLVPLLIPTEGAGRSGDLILFPNKRPFRSSVTLNIFEKALTRNWLYRKFVLYKFNRAPEKYSVSMKPGNVYLFWGYRTFHGNGPCAPNAVRATLLLHYGNPHGRNAVLEAVKTLRQTTERNRLRRLATRRE